MTMSPKKPYVFSMPEKPETMKMLLMWAFIIIGLAFIVWLFSVAKPMPDLVCTDPYAGLTNWGTCHDAE